MKNLDKYEIITTNGDKFCGKQSVELAYLIFLRFGKDYNVAHLAWKRMLQNNCSLESFKYLVDFKLEDKYMFGKRCPKCGLNEANHIFYSNGKGKCEHIWDGALSKHKRS